LPSDFLTKILAGNTFVASEVSSAEVVTNIAETPRTVLSLEDEPGATGIIRLPFLTRYNLIKVRLL
jgi:hypothetical protein